jgi:hypothetical protein
MDDQGVGDVAIYPWHNARPFICTWCCKVWLLRTAVHYFAHAWLCGRRNARDAASGRCNKRGTWGCILHKCPRWDEMAGSKHEDASQSVSLGPIVQVFATVSPSGLLHAIGGVGLCGQHSRHVCMRTVHADIN